MDVKPGCPHLAEAVARRSEWTSAGGRDSGVRRVWLGGAKRQVYECNHSSDRSL